LGIFFQLAVSYRGTDVHGLTLSGNFIHVGNLFDVHECISLDQPVAQEQYQLGATSINPRLLTETP
jgi:hypothetical protein